MLNVYEQVGRNKTRSALVIFGFCLFFTLVIYIIGRAVGYGPSVIGIALIVSGLSSFLGYWYSDKIILTLSAARPATQQEDNLFKQVTENLCISAGLPIPRLYVIEDTAPNAFATGRDARHAVICITTGLLSKLNRTELEGVIGHELSHIKNYDMLLMSVVSVLLGSIVLLSDWLVRSSWRRGDREQSNNLFIILGIVTAILAPIIGQLISLALSRRREFLADAGSVMFTRQPSGLIRALKIIANDNEPLEAANKATANLFIVNPFKGESNKNNNKLANLFNTHPPIEERINQLENML